MYKILFIISVYTNDYIHDTKYAFGMNTSHIAKYELCK